MDVGDTVKHLPSGRFGMYDGHCDCSDHKCKANEVVVLTDAGRDIVCPPSELELIPEEETE